MKGKNMNYIYNKDSFENSVEVDNYPWGFRLKTKKRYWIETNKKGSRFMSCTLNPKNNQWCKPKASIYEPVMVMTSEEKEGKTFINYIQLDMYCNNKTIVQFTKEIDVDKLPLQSQKKICLLKSKNYAWEGVEVKFVSNPSPEESKKMDENKAKVEKYMIAKANNAYSACLAKNNLN